MLLMAHDVYRDGDDPRVYLGAANESLRLSRREAP